MQEYLIWIVQERQFLWYRLQAGDYQLQLPDKAGVVSSQIFPELWLAVEALLAGEMQQVLAVLQAGLDSEMHRSFVARLRPVTEGL